jgi:hypothetical protein
MKQVLKRLPKILDWLLTLNVTAHCQLCTGKLIHICALPALYRQTDTHLRTVSSVQANWYTFAHCQLCTGKLIHICALSALYRQTDTHLCIQRIKNCSNYAENNTHYSTKFVHSRFLRPIIICMKTTIFWEVMSCSLEESLSEFTSQLANEFNTDIFL